MSEAEAETQARPVYCPDCVARQGNLGDPSHARWLGPDGGVYCSIHFIQKFGHSETLVRIDGYVSPTTIKSPAPKEIA